MLKKIFYGIMGLALINTFAFAIPTNGLVGYWSAEGQTANDFSGNANHGSLQGNTSFANGKVGQAFRFDGSGDFVDVPDSDSLDTGTQFSFGAWFKTDDVNRVDPASGAQIQTIITYGRSNINGRNNVLSIVDQKLKFIVRGTTSGFEDFSGTTILQSDVWYHAAITYDGTTARMYLDGNLEASRNVIMAMDANSKVLIGRYRNPANLNFFFDFQGAIDEAVVYNRTLSDNETQSLASPGIIPEPSSCILLFLGTLMGIFRFYIRNIH